MLTRGNIDSTNCGALKDTKSSVEGPSYMHCVRQNLCKSSGQHWHKDYGAEAQRTNIVFSHDNVGTSVYELQNQYFF